MEKIIADLRAVAKRLGRVTPALYKLHGKYKLSPLEFARAFTAAFQEREVIKPREPKILVFDIETSYMHVKSWRLGENVIRHGQILKDWMIIAFCAKWLSPKEDIYKKDRKPDVIYMDLRNSVSDKPLVKKLWSLLDEADMIITKNGKRFDLPKTRARWALNGIFQEPSDYSHRDVESMSRARFAFSSHSLEYLAENLNTRYKKLKHKAFPGEELWDECAAGNIKAWNEMQRYNTHDVLATEELYYKLLPFGAPHNVNAYTNTFGCPTCGSTDFKRDGTRTSPTTGAQTQRFLCKKCFHRFSANADLRSTRQKNIFKGSL